MIYKAISLFLLSAVKFALAPASGFALGFSTNQVILITSIGGVTGVLFFYSLSGFFIKRALKSKKQKLEKAKLEGKIIENKSFTFKNKLIVKIKRKFGIWGIALITPAIISIPVGSILSARFYRRDKKTLSVLSLSVILWSVCLSLFFNIFTQ